MLAPATACTAATNVSKSGTPQSQAGTALRQGASEETLIYARTKNLGPVQLLLGHFELESTARYLGIEVDDALEISEQTEV